MNKTLSIPALFAVVLLLLSAQVIFAEPYKLPSVPNEGEKLPCNPPKCNPDLPINTGSSAQEKAGNLSLLGQLDVVKNISGADIIAMDSSPALKLYDTTDDEIWYVANNLGNKLMFRKETTGVKGFTDETDRFAIHEDHVRAPKYCDLNGKNCLAGGTSTPTNGLQLGDPMPSGLGLAERRAMCAEGNLDNKDNYTATYSHSYREYNYVDWEATDLSIDSDTLIVRYDYTLWDGGGDRSSITGYCTIGFDGSKYYRIHKGSSKYGGDRGEEDNEGGGTMENANGEGGSLF